MISALATVAKCSGIEGFVSGVRLGMDVRISRSTEMFMFISLHVLYQKPSPALALTSHFISL